MRYLFFLLLVISINSSAQDYNADIISHREHYKKEFLEDKRSPLREDQLKDLDFFAPDSSYRIDAKVEMLIGEQSFMMPTFSGTSKEYIRYAVLHFKIGDVPTNLTVYKNIALSKQLEYRDYLFLPFTDLTNGKESYSGGRYLDLKTNELEGGNAQIDFNKAYNPYCAYSDGYQCPKPPAENQLQLSIPAGERKFKEKNTH